MHLPYLECVEFPDFPWGLHRYQLVSWFDMLQFSGDAFFWASRSLRDIRTDCLVAAMICIDGEPGVQMAQDIDERARKKAIASLTIVKSEFRKIGLLITADTAQDIESELGKTTRHSYEWLHTQIDCLEKVAEKELKGKAFFYIPPERAQFWPKLSEPYAFGKAVADSFPSCAFDANYAGIALAVGLSTASVFYLMRVLESGLAVLGLEFGVSLAHTNWQPAIAEIERKIRDMHTHPKWKDRADCKEVQEFYSQAASHFGILKDACRNPTMHGRTKYSQDEAEQIFETVKAFMQKLAERLDENLIPTPYDKS